MDQTRHQRIAKRLADLMETSGIQLKRLKLAAQESKAYAETVLETVREPFVVLDRDLRVVSANQSFYQTFQVPPEEVDGHLIYEMGNDQWDIPRLRVLLEEVLPRDTLVQDFEVNHEFPTIGRRAMLLNAHRISRNNEATAFILLAFEDITERHRAEEEHGKVRETLESQLQNRTDELKAAHEQLKGEVNERQRAGEELGKVRETLESQLQNRTDDLKVAHEHLKSEVTVRQRVEEELGKVRETLESQLQNRTDDLKAAHEQLKSEVNERQRAEEEQRSQNEFIENVVQNIKDGLVVFDRDLRITYWNNAMEEISGTAADEVLGKVALEVFPHLIEEGVDELLKAALAGQDAARSNISHKTSNGKVRRTNERYLPMRDLAGDVTGALAIVEDVTEALRLKLYVDHLEEEFKECMLVDIAMGIIIQEFALSAAQGYRLIKKHSLDKKRKVGEVAMEIITLFGSPEEQKKSGKRFIGSIDE